MKKSGNPMNHKENYMESVFSSDNVICPYCEHEFYPDDFTEYGDSAEWQCPKCEKNFYMNWDWSPNFYSYQAPCLNGGEHIFKKIIGAPKEHFIGKIRCQFCSLEKTDFDVWEKLTNESKSNSM